MLFVFYQNKISEVVILLVEIKTNEGTQVITAIAYLEPEIESREGIVFYTIRVISVDKSIINEIDCENLPPFEHMIFLSDWTPKAIADGVSYIYNNKLNNWLEQKAS
jgi:hypothetical protein